jgi:malic enzyme
MAKKKVADLLVEVLADAGLRRIYGVSGDSQNGITDSIRASNNIQRVHVKHEETAAFAAGAENRVSGWPQTSNGHIGLADVIRKTNATILIGLSTVGGAFSEEIVREMARKVPRPIIFPLSNPTTRSEANADDLIRWTDERALVATGSPFAPVSFGGHDIPIAQCNNV